MDHPDLADPSGRPVMPTVLVVDDDPSMRTVLERMVRFQGFVALVATDPEEAMTALQHNEVTAFIMDLNLRHGRSGLEVLTWLRSQRRYEHIPVYVLTGQLDVSDDQRAAIRRYGGRVFYKGLSMQALFVELKAQLTDPNAH